MHGKSAEVQVQALTREIMSCPWGEHFTLNLPFSTQVYKSVID